MGKHTANSSQEDFYADDTTWQHEYCDPNECDGSNHEGPIFGIARDAIKLDTTRDQFNKPCCGGLFGHTSRCRLA